MNDNTSTTFGRVEMFVGNNYHIWAMKIASILRGRNLYRDIIEGDEPVIPADRSADNSEGWKKHNEWETKNDEAFGLIILSLVTEQAAMFINETRARVVWESLKNMYGGNNEEKIIDAMLELKDLKISRNENVDQYVTRIKGMVAKITALGGKVSTREAVYYLVRGLDEKLESIAIVLRARKDQNIDEVHQILKEEENRLNKNIHTNNWDKNSENAFRSSNKRGQQFQGRVKSKECYICNKIGHIAKDCWHRNKQSKFNNLTNKGRDKMRNESAQMTHDEGQRHNALYSGLHEGEAIKTYSKWNLDSGCSVHMTSDESYLNQSIPHDSIITMAESGREIKATAKGSMNMKTIVDNKEVRLKMSNVLYVPKLRDNLLSVRELVRRGNRVEFDETGAIIYGKAGKIIAIGKEENNMYIVEGWINDQTRNNDESKRKTEQCAQSQHENKLTWHRRLGHLNQYYMDKMLRENTVRDLTYSKTKDLQCESCILGKMSETPYTKTDGLTASRPLDLLYMDLCGPMRIATLGNNRYIFVIIDAYSKRIFVELLAHKNETYDKFMTFKRRTENEMGTRINRVRTDNGTEFVNQRFTDMFKQEGVKHERTVIYSPSSNGAAERTNRTLLGTVRTMLLDSGLPTNFWGEATVTAAYLRNCSYRKGLDGITPMEKWSGRKPSVKHLKPFGCIAYGLTPKPIRTKLDPRARKGIMVGYSRTRRAYRLYMLDKGRIEEFRSVKFMEEEKGNKHMGIQNTDITEIELIKYNIDEHNNKTQPDTKNNYLNRYITYENKQSTPHSEENLGQINDEEDTTTEENQEATDEDIIDQDQEPQMEQRDNQETRRRGRPHGTIKGVVPVREKEKNNETEQELCIRGVRRSTRIENKEREIERVNQTIIKGKEKNIPTNYKEAIESEDGDMWRKAMEAELQSMEEHEVWDLVKREAKIKILRNKWVFTKKLDADGNPSKYKARLVVMGQNQQKGIDYEENYSPVVKLESVRLIVTLASAFGQAINTLDVKTAYLYGNLKEETYMTQPDGYIKDTNKVCRLKKSLYGLPQSGRMWNLKLNETLKSIGAQRLSSDPCLYTVKKKKEMAILGIYVDDILLTGSSQHIIDEVTNMLGEKFQLTKGTQDGPFLGIEIKRTDTGYELSQKKQIDKLLEKYGMKECNGAKTPVDLNQKIEEHENSNTVDTVTFQELIGSLSYIANGTRPDIAFTVNKLARYNKNPKEIHLNAAKRVVRYLKGTKEVKLNYQQKLEPLEGYSDASWSATEDCKSQTGYCIKLCGNLISWKSRKQDLVALSSCEAELNANCEVLKEIQWLTNVLTELELEHLIQPPVKIYTDSKAGLEWANGLYVKQRTKHFNRKMYKIREEIENKKVILVHKPGEEMEADLLTKGLPIAKMKNCMESIGLK